MRNIRLLIQYDGTAYHGWQRQNNDITIQEELETKLSTILRESITLIGSGRTDSGVHALGQVANFKTKSHLPSKQIISALNGFLNKDIRIFKCEDVDIDFHSRFSAMKREYKYIIYNGLVCPPFIMKYVYWLKKPLNIEKLKCSLKILEGEHDFTSFCAKSDESKSKVRTIHKTEVIQNKEEITILISANSFLRKMIRMILGVVIDINLKNKPLDEVTKILSLKSRDHNYYTVPASGLYLNQVWY